MLIDKTNILNEVLDYFNKRFPYLDTRVGTAVRDLLIDPLVDYLYATYKEFNEKRDLDLIMQNFFIERRKGIPASGIARVYVNTKKYYSIKSSVKFVSPNGLVYHPISNIDISPSQIYTDILKGELYFTVPIIAEDFGDQYNLVAGTKLEVDPFDKEVISGEAHTDIVGGISEETDEEFYKRASEMLTLRNFVSPKSIKATLLSEFDFVYKAEAIGYGDPEMIRDIAPGTNYHIGGKADIYVKTSDGFHVKEVVVPNNRVIEQSGMVMVTDLKGNTILGIQNDPVTDFSAKAKVTLPVDYIGKTVKVYYIPFIDFLQRFFESADRRVLTFDPLIKTFYPALIDLDLTVNGDIKLTDDEIKALLNYYIKTIDTFKISDIVNLMYEFGATYVKHPVFANVHLFKGINDIATYQVYDYFTLIDESINNITDRVITFYPGEININIVKDGRKVTITPSLIIKYDVSYSTAGARDAYIYFAKKAHPDIQDVSVMSPSPGVVNVYVLLKKNAQDKPENVIAAVQNALNDEQVRPLTDKVNVYLATEQPFDINIDWYIKPDYVNIQDMVTQEVENAVNNYIDWQTSKIGRAINPSVLIKNVMEVNGVEHVVVNNPSNYTSIPENTALKLNNSIINFKGTV